MRRPWLNGLHVEFAAHHIVLEDCIATAEAATARRDRLEAHIEAALADWSRAPVVRALQALRGMALVAELGDITRFDDPRQLMADLGLAPAEHSRGATLRQGGITKAGNGAARRMLIEAAWSDRFPARLSREQRRASEDAGPADPRHRVKGTAATVPTTSQTRSGRQASDGRDRRDRTRAVELCLGDRPAGDADTGTTG